MKLERLHEYTLTTAVIGVGMGLALAAGNATGTGQMKSVGIIIADICLLAICLVWRTGIWLVIFGALSETSPCLLGSRSL